MVDQMISRMKEGGLLEPKDDLYVRGQQVKKMLKHFHETHPLGNTEKIGVVCHS